MKVHSYISSGGRDIIIEYINSLTVNERIDAFSVLEDLEKDRFDGLVTKRWQGKIWEVYFKKHNRIFYVTMHGTDIYLLHACKKQKNKTEKIDKKLVINRAKELGVILNQRFI